MLCSLLLSDLKTNFAFKRNITGKGNNLFLILNKKLSLLAHQNLHP